MALNFNLQDVCKRLGEENFELYTTHPDDYGKANKRWHPVSDMLISLSMACRFDRITEANALQVAARIATYEAKRGPSFMAQGKTFGIAFEDVWHHVGLWTNADTCTKAQFERHFGKMLSPNMGPSAHSIIAQAHAQDAEGALS
jgi:hypothetical protein